MSVKAENIAADKKICPLSIGAERRLYCFESNCAWWVESIGHKNGHCGITNFARSSDKLRYIAEKVGNEIK